MAHSHTHRLRVRYSECDMQGHVFNGNWLTYFDEASGAQWRDAIGGWPAVLERGLDLVVADAHVRFLAPAYLDDELDLEARIERLGTSSITTAFTCRRDGETLVEGTLVHVTVEPKTYKKIEIPDWVREAFA